MSHELHLDSLSARLEGMPGVERVREAAERSGTAAFLVGGSVRDALLGLARADLDVAVEGDPLAFAALLGGEVRSHPAFLTATALTPEGPIDVAATRTESYPHPGSLPVVRPASLAEDLRRRDFTVNAIAVDVRELAVPIDPCGGVRDLARGVLRALHHDSFRDDPTRALRAARYASRLELAPDAETERLLRAADLTTVSAERTEDELRRLALEARAPEGFRLLAAWGLMDIDPAMLQLIAAVAAAASAGAWSPEARSGAILKAVRGDTERAERLAAARPRLPSEEVAAAHGHSAAELLLARALGASWIDRYLETGRHVRLEITGHDLIEAGIPPGPALGAGLDAALRAKLDGEAHGRDAELEVAIRAARQTSP